MVSPRPPWRPLQPHSALLQLILTTRGATSPPNCLSIPPCLSPRPGPGLANPLALLLCSSLGSSPPALPLSPALPPPGLGPLLLPRQPPALPAPTLRPCLLSSPSVSLSAPISVPLPPPPSPSLPLPSLPLLPLSPPSLPLPPSPPSWFSSFPLVYAQLSAPLITSRGNPLCSPNEEATALPSTHRMPWKVRAGRPRGRDKHGPPRLVAESTLPGWPVGTRSARCPGRRAPCPPCSGQGLGRCSPAHCSSGWA